MLLTYSHLNKHICISKGATLLHNKDWTNSHELSEHDLQNKEISLSISNV